MKKKTYQRAFREYLKRGQPSQERRVTDGLHTAADYAEMQRARDDADELRMRTRVVTRLMIQNELVRALVGTLDKLDSKDGSDLFRLPKRYERELFRAIDAAVFDRKRRSRKLIK